MHTFTFFYIAAKLSIFYKVSISRLYAIQDFTFLCFRRCGDYRDGFMEISIQRLVFRLDDFHTILSQNSHKFIVNQFHPFFYGIDIRCRFHRLDGGLMGCSIST